MHRILQSITYILFYILLMLVFLTLLVQTYIYLQPQKDSFLGSKKDTYVGKENEVQCANLKRKYPKVPNLSCSVGSSNKEYPLKNFYVKTAYNAIALENYITGKLDICALTNCLAQGARCLDFEILSGLDSNNRPEVYVATNNQKRMFNTMSSKNKIPLSDVFKTLRNQAFSDICPCPNDPCILHIRIKSSDKRIISMIVNEIKTFLRDKLLSMKYSYGCKQFQNQIGNVPLKDLAQKFILLFHAPELSIRNTTLYEYANGITDSETIKTIYFDQSTGVNKDLIEFNKNAMTFVLPQITNKFENYDYGVAKMNGCQFIAMSIQNKDEYMDDYNNFFLQNRYSFVLKPESIRSLNS